METPLAPMVNIDGSAVRRKREEKNLTQLYVAKVVGVTTDTISRWENNRYPTIRRENVLRLAEALEVPAEEIIRRDDGFSPTERGPGGRPRFVLWLALLFLAGLFAAGWFALGRKPQEPLNLAERMAPGHVAPGSVLPVRISIDPELSGQGYILREQFPAGWNLIEANPPASSLDNQKGIARWIVKPGEERHKVVYLVRIAADAPLGSHSRFSGELVTKGDGKNRSSLVGGTDGTNIAPFIWADVNRDGVIDDAEMLEASDLFDEMSGVHLDWGFLESIWDAGHYRWVEKQHSFQPVATGPADPN